jgi:hypothetical protein
MPLAIPHRSALIAVAVYYMLKNKTMFDVKKFIAA